MESVLDIKKVYSLEEYIRIDEKGPDRHEFYNGKLIAIPGEALLHNSLCISLLLLLKNLLPEYKIYIESVKVNIEGEDKYVYPDITVIKQQTDEELPFKDYIIYKPLLIAEILSDSTRKHDLTDEFILYQKISSLQYYLAIEPEKQLVLFYEKTSDGEWTAKAFTRLDETVELPNLNTQLKLADLYSF